METKFKKLEIVKPDDKEVSFLSKRGLMLSSMFFVCLVPYSFAVLVSTA
jgi:hypothetical protein